MNNLVSKKNKFYIIVFKFLLKTILLSFAFEASAVQNICPIPPTAIAPIVEVKINQDLKTKLYDFKYTISNHKEALLPISVFFIKVDSKPKIIKAPANWIGLYNDYDGDPHVSFVGGDNTIKPGSKMGDFEIVSEIAPGYSLFKAVGDAKVPQAPYCPGFFNELSGWDKYSNYLTQSPTKNEANYNKIKIQVQKNIKLNSQKIPILSPLDSGIISIKLSSKDLEIKKIDFNSLELGFGKAKIKSSSFVNEGSYEILLLNFDLKEIKIRCNIDRFIYLKGRVGGNNLLGSVEIIPSRCESKFFPDYKNKNQNEADD